MKKLIVKRQLIPAQKILKLVELEKQYKIIKIQRDKIKAELLEIMQVNDVLNLKTGTYTLYRGKRVTPQIIDFELVKKGLDKLDIPYITKEVFAEQMMPVFKMMIEEDRMVDGMEALTTEYIGIVTPKEGGK